jgi:Uma2 family endonuclease
VSSLPEPYITPEEYLAGERSAPTKSEYWNGHIYDMAGASRQHNQITLNLAVNIGAQLKGRSCYAYVSDMRVKVNTAGLYTYPDLVALCGEPLFEDDQLDTLLNPQVIIEVLSESTEAYDRGAKFSHYSRIPSLVEYVLIAQDRYCVDHFVRRGNQWVLTEMTDSEDDLSLETLACRMSLLDIYDKVDFVPKQKESP